MKRIKEWWRGHYVPSTLESLFPGYGQPPRPDAHYKRPWIARLLIAIGRFWVKNWQFIITTIVAIIALFIAYA